MQTAVLLHGFTQTGASWDPVVAALVERYRVLAPDLPGHGSASAVDPITLERVIAQIAEPAPERFALCGYSMGGRLALHVALALPDRVTRLILIGASPGIADDDERAARGDADEQLAGEIEQSTIEAFAARWATTPVLADVPAHVASVAHEDRLRNSPSGMARALRALGAAALPSLWDRLGEIAVPVTLIAGERDEKFTAVAELMAPRLSNPRIEVIAKAGHAPQLEFPREVSLKL